MMTDDTTDTLKTLATALKDLDRFEFEFSIQKPSADKIEGKFVGFLKDKNKTVIDIGD